MEKLIRLCRCTRGATAIEYALIATLISIAAIAGMSSVGTRMTTMYNNVSNSL